MKRLIALMLCAALLLCGCAGAKNALGFSGIVKFEEMEYVRPDMDAVADAALAAIEAAETARTPEQVMDAVWEYYDVYNDFQTDYDLAHIHYHADLTDFYWQTEEAFCAENYAQLDAYLEDIYEALAESPHRAELEEEYFGAGYFDDYEGEGFYDEELMALLEQEQALIGEYYELASDFGLDAWDYYDQYAVPLARILAELVALRQEMAAWAGYDSYPEFAWDFYYYRDYTPEQAGAYLEQIREELVPLYRELNQEDPFAAGWEDCSEKEVFGYVRSAAEAMGGVTAEAFRLLEQAELYDISSDSRKSGMSFEVYLSKYYEPYVFLTGSESRYDCLTFAHEFGHFATDYAAAGSTAGIDVLEIFSQGMEYLSLCYGEGGEELVELKLADCLCTYVEQAAYAAFEEKMYSLTGEELTAENLLALYEQVCTDYGFDSMADWESWDLVTVQHYYSNPMYIISYVVSNDAALQLYQLELQTPGAGRDIFENSLATEEGWFLAFLEEAGLQSPLGRVKEVRSLLEEKLS